MLSWLSFFDFFSTLLVLSASLRLYLRTLEYEVDTEKKCNLKYRNMSHNRFLLVQLYYLFSPVELDELYEFDRSEADFALFLFFDILGLSHFF